MPTCAQAAAHDLTAAFDALMLRILDPAPPSSHTGVSTGLQHGGDEPQESVQGVAQDGGAEGGSARAEQGAQEEQAGGVDIPGGGRQGSVGTAHDGRSAWRGRQGGSGGGGGGMLAASPVTRSMHDYRHTAARGERGGAWLAGQATWGGIWAGIGAVMVVGKGWVGRGHWS